VAIKVQRLGLGWEAAIEKRLLDDVEVNLFLLGFRRLHELDQARWYGAVEGDRVLGLALLVPDRLLVPWCPDPSHAMAIGLHLRTRADPCMLVGPREAGDALWEAWAGGHVSPDRFYDQRLYVLRRPPVGDPVPGFRRARMSEWRQIALYSGVMEDEDLGRNPHHDFPALHERVVRERVRNGRTWLIVRNRQILFQINIGTALDIGAQIGGTYVPPLHRGLGYATQGTRALCQHLMNHHPFVSLHVNEANTPAVQVYEKVGFHRSMPFRLITIR